MVAQSFESVENYLGSSGSVVCFGNFDGLHRGHRHILSTCLDSAKRKGLASVLFTFEPHPRQVLRPNEAPRLLWTREERREIFPKLHRGSEGFQSLIFQNFIPSFYSLSADAFIEHILKEKLRCQTLICGSHFRFGSGARGDIAMLRSKGLEVIQVEPVSASDGRAISSTEIRSCIEKGNLKTALDSLGAPYFLSGTVIKGDGRGRLLNFPTANLSTSKECLPGAGVYLCVAQDLSTDQLFAAAVNCGRRPTFEGASPSIEAHFICFQDRLYDRELRIYFLERLRDEKKFESLQKLQTQIGQDIREALRIFQTEGLLPSNFDALPMQNLSTSHFLAKNFVAPVYNLA